MNHTLTAFLDRVLTSAEEQELPAGLVLALVYQVEHSGACELVARILKTICEERQ